MNLVLEGEVNVTTRMGFVALPGTVASPGVWISACPGIGMKRAGTILSSECLCYVSGDSGCSVGACEVAFPSIPLLGSLEPCTGS